MPFWVDFARNVCMICPNVVILKHQIVCEVKYSQDEYELDKDEYEKINRRRNTFIKETRLRHASWLTMITTEGLSKGMYSEMIQNQVTLDDLFVNV